MQLLNLKHSDDSATFAQAVRRGIARDNGLYFPTRWPHFERKELLAGDFHQRATRVIEAFIGDEFAHDDIAAMVGSAFHFAPALIDIAPQTKVLELFHGPTLAFKDFGARFLAQVLSALIRRGDHRGPLTILSATSGDTGAAVAQAFYGLSDVRVVILYPQGRISPLQEKLFCTQGGNITTLAVQGDFDQCQALVKAAFADTEFVRHYGLNSANSINFARLLAQVCYYVEACALWPQASALEIAVPSGNFGNITAGLMAQKIGAPIRRLLAITNANDTVPRYLQSGVWDVRATHSTLSNAMDVSAPNNWPRAESLDSRTIGACAISEAQTRAAMRELQALGYLAEPHTAVAYAGLQQLRNSGSDGLFLSTAHPAKFRESLAEHLGEDLALPPALQAVADKPVLSQMIAADLALVRAAIARAWS